VVTPHPITSSAGIDVPLTDRTVDCMPAPKDLSAAQARRLLAAVTPTGEVDQTRHRVAMELVEDLERIYQRKKAADREPLAQVKRTGTRLLALHGIGPSGAGKLLAEVGDITRFPDKGLFASWSGTAPIDVSSGDHKHHQLLRGLTRRVARPRTVRQFRMSEGACVPRRR
jgi:transposase